MRSEALRATAKKKGETRRAVSFEYTRMVEGVNSSFTFST